MRQDLKKGKEFMFSPYDNEIANERYRNRIMRESQPAIMLIGLFVFLLLFMMLAFCIVNTNCVMTSLGF